MKIIPAILASTKEELQAQLNKVAALGDLISYDVADDFVEGLVTPPIAEYPQLPEGKKVFWHLMVNNPLDLIQDCLSFPTQIIAIHAESQEPDRVLQHIKQLGVKAGLVFNPTTNPKNFKDLIQLADVAQIMTVTPGAQGRGFDSSNLDQISWIRSVNPNIEIAIDGSVNLDTIKEVSKYNPDFIVVGSFLTKAKNPKEDLSLLEDSV